MFFKRKASKLAPAVRTPAAKAQPARPAKPKPAKAPLAAAADDGELDGRTLGRALWRRKWAIVLPTMMVAALSAVAVNMLTPKYKSEARILYEGRENVFLRPEADRANVDRGSADPEALMSQVQLVLSREL